MFNVPMYIALLVVILPSPSPPSFPERLGAFVDGNARDFLGDKNTQARDEGKRGGFVLLVFVFKGGKREGRTRRADDVERARERGGG